MEAKNIIEITNLTKNYGSARGIENISLNVLEGEIFGFIGPNGAGKSTTIRTLLSLIYKTSGNAKIFGLDIERDRDEILRNVGYLPSEVFYYDKMKVIELLKYSASFYKKDCTKRIKEIGEILELDLNRKIQDLSYGNRKKVGIVQGLLHSPKLIILDEPTGGLDPLMQSKFFDLIREENRKGATVLFSSHILSEVQNTCSRVAIIREGKIVRIEKISTLRDSSYKKIIITPSEKVDSKKFSQIQGVANFEDNENTFSFFFGGNINLIMKELQNIELKNISIEEPSLEELFMHYYK